MAVPANVKIMRSAAELESELGEHHCSHIAIFEINLSSANFVCCFLPFTVLFKEFLSLD